MFDPFNDFDSAGYLRNFDGEKDLTIVKVVEHELFRANLPEAVDYLAHLRTITYQDFLKVHKCGPLCQSLGIPCVNPGAGAGAIAAPRR